MTQSHQFLLPNSFIFNPISPNNSSSLSTRCPYLRLNRFHSRKLTITCARSSSNKGLFGSQRSRKTLIRLVNFAASNLHYVLPLPEPLNSVMREFGSGSGSGGSGGSWKGFGSGGFDGRKRKVNRKSQFWFWGFAAVCCLGFWGLILGGELELEKDVLLGALCLSMFLVLIRNGCVPEWVLGFGSGAAVVGVSVWKKDELKRLVKGFKGMGVLRRRPRGRRAI